MVCSAIEVVCSAIEGRNRSVIEVFCSVIKGNVFPSITEHFVRLSRYFLLDNRTTNLFSYEGKCISLDNRTKRSVIGVFSLDNRTTDLFGYQISLDNRRSVIEGLLYTRARSFTHTHHTLVCFVESSEKKNQH